MLEIVAAAKTAEVEFCEWWIASPLGDNTLVGHIEVIDRRAVAGVLDALLDLDHRLDLDVGPSTTDTLGRWSVWVRAHYTQQDSEPRE